MTGVDRPGIAVLGCGYWGANHLRVWHELGSLRVVCDTDPARVAAVVEQYPGVRGETDPDAVFADPEIAGVVIATPAVTHASLGVRAMTAGKHVLVEKPLAVDLADAERLVQTAAEQRRVLLVGHVLEYHPAVTELRKLVERGELGKIRYVYSNRLNFGRLRVEENAMWSFAPHDIALTLRIVGEAPSEVSCRGAAYLSRDVADTTLMSLAFDNGVQGHVFVSWLHPFKEQRFVVVGDAQMAVFDDTAPADEKLLLYPHRVDWMGGRVPVARKAEATPVELARVEPLRAECEEFLACIASGVAPLTDGASALAVLRVLDAGERSLRSSGAPIALAETGRDWFAHPTAVVDDGARIGPRTRIWHFTHVMGGATVGADVSIGQDVFVADRVRVGDRVKVQNGVSLFTGVELEDDVFCGPAMSFTNVINPRAWIERKDEFRPTLVRKGASLGANCTIVCGSTIGRFAFVGAGAVVTRDVPDHGLVVGNPARLVGWVCTCGTRLQLENGRATCADCASTFVERPDGSGIDAAS